MRKFLVNGGNTPFSPMQFVQLKDNLPQLDRVERQRVIYCDGEQMQAEQSLATILNASLAEETLTGYFTYPRAGLQSPWSSKAIDILHDCGCTWVQRCESGFIVRLLDKAGNSLPLPESLWALLYDPMTEAISATWPTAAQLWQQPEAPSMQIIPLLKEGVAALELANSTWGLALSEPEMAYLEARYKELDRDPTDVELMMFAQANSEHCRHKIFNAAWHIDGQPQAHSLFAMIKHTSSVTPHGILTAYADNAAAIVGHHAQRLQIQIDGTFGFDEEDIDIVMKVETHNHPTAIAPFPGAATGAGGEIRDEGATGRGAKPKAGLCGFSVSNLQIPEYIRPWEQTPGRPETIASPLQIMLDGPVGAAAFNNEFGRANLCGYFRSFEQLDKTPVAIQWRGYHKPIMIAGGMGNIRRQHVKKEDVAAGSLIIVLGGPSYNIGLGGGAASSQTSGAQQAELDFASVQRANPEMQRRCQEVIERCIALDESNPILSIHDVGAGGLANAIPEILHDSGRGGDCDLSAIPCAQAGMSSLAIWCNESQERYVLAVHPEQFTVLSAFAERERCPLAVVGSATDITRFRLRGQDAGEAEPIDIPMPLLFGNTPRLLRQGAHECVPRQELNCQAISLADAAVRVLQHPTVASKQFLITIGDRSVGGLVARDQMVGPWQVPVADCAVTHSSFEDFCGEAMAMGERAPVAILDARASARLSIGEAITNLASAPISVIGDIKLSANWMAACGIKAEDTALFDAVEAAATEFCPELGISIPVGKDSLSMRTRWQDEEVVAPLSLVISAFAPVVDVRQTLTPVLQRDQGATDLILIDLGAGKNRLGASILAQTYNQLGRTAPDCDDASRLKQFFYAIQVMRQQDCLLAYHDRSDGGLFATLCEMAFASHCGLTCDLSALGDEPLRILFNEELGAVIQTPRVQRDEVLEVLQAHGLADCSHVFATLNDDDKLYFYHQQQLVLAEDRVTWHKHWAQTSFAMQALRDDADCAAEEYASLDDVSDPGLNVKLSFTPSASCHVKTSFPRVAILREQGVNSHMEMAAAFMQAGFTAVDVHMSDLIDGRLDLSDFQGLAACGGFSYGDVLGAGRGWAATILHQERVREQMQAFFRREDTFTLGVCNGCQMLSQLGSLIPGAEHWPTFVRNRSQQFEARLSLVEILPSNSIFLQDMAGSILPVVVSHGEGQAQFSASQTPAGVIRYVDNTHQATQRYPANPNGSTQGFTGMSSTDGRVLMMMPHPERSFRSSQLSWQPQTWGPYSPWLRLFQNARHWCD